jgi:hypothetical protein
MSKEIASARLCACGCGKVTPIAPETRPKRGWKMGEPMPYFPHHSKNRWPVSDGVTKLCRKCLKTKPTSEFFVNRKNADGYQAACKTCAVATTYSYRATDGGLIRTVVARHKNALKRFRMTQQDYDNLFAKQNYACAICEKPERVVDRKGAIRRLAVDHCHTTGHVRGLLCCHCNHAIGKLNDDPALLRRAAEYVEASRLSLEQG